MYNAYYIMAIIGFELPYSVHIKNIAYAPAEHTRDHTFYRRFTQCR